MKNSDLDLGHIASNTDARTPLSARKPELRAGLLESRRRRAETGPEALRAAETGFLEHLLPRILDETGAGDVVAAFLPTTTEPPIRAVLHELIRARRRVVVPISLPHRVLEWAEWTPDAPVAVSRFGIEEPIGGRLGAAAFQEARWRIVPALAVGRDGTRLGYGGGYYDNCLGRLAPERTAGVVFEDELLDEVPAEPHDARLARVCTPSGMVETSPGPAPV